MVRVLITEAHEGLGLALVKEYLADAENQVIAFCGDESKRDELDALNQTVSETQLLVVDVNLADEESIKASVEPIEDFVDALDLLIFNTGFIPEGYVSEQLNEPTDEEIRMYMPKLGLAPLWMKENLFPLLLRGQNSRCIGISPYMSRPYNIAAIQNLKTKGKKVFETALYMFGSFASGIAPDKISVIHIGVLARFVLLRRIDTSFSVDILDEMNMISVTNQDSISNKAKALYENIPNLPFGQHFDRGYGYLGF